MIRKERLMECGRCWVKRYAFVSAKSSVAVGGCSVVYLVLCFLLCRCVPCIALLRVTILLARYLFLLSSRVHLIAAKPARIPFAVIHIYSPLVFFPRSSSIHPFSSFAPTCSPIPIASKPNTSFPTMATDHTSSGMKRHVGDSGSYDPAAKRARSSQVQSRVMHTNPVVLHGSGGTFDRHAFRTRTLSHACVSD